MLFCVERGAASLDPRLPSESELHHKEEKSITLSSSLRWGSDSLPPPSFNVGVKSSSVNHLDSLDVSFPDSGNETGTEPGCWQSPNRRNVFLFFAPSEQLERDVKDALLSMAKQSGKIDPDVSPNTDTYKYITRDIVDCPSHSHTNNTGHTTSTRTK